VNLYCKRLTDTSAACTSHSYETVTTSTTRTRTNVNILTVPRPRWIKRLQWLTGKIDFPDLFSILFANRIPVSITFFHLPATLPSFPDYVLLISPSSNLTDQKVSIISKFRSQWLPTTSLNITQVFFIVIIVLLLLLSLSLIALVSYCVFYRNLLFSYSATQPQVCVIKLNQSVFTGRHTIINQYFIAY